MKLNKKYEGWLEEHKNYCNLVMERLKRYGYNYQLIYEFPKYYKEWKKIDRKKDKSLSSEDFRFWLYLRLVNKHKYKKV